MQKRANRILSALMALIMIVSMLPATVFATDDTESVLEGWNVALGENIGVRFHLSSADYTVTTTVNGEEVEPTISDKVVTVNVAAAQMTDTIGLTVKDGEDTVHTGTYSVRQYAETILTGDYDHYVKEMVKAMLNYGAAAQTYFSYNTGNPANAGYTWTSSASVPTESPEINVTDNLDGISLYGMSLIFQNTTAVRFYFTVEEGYSINDFTFSQGTPVANGARYYVEVGGINPQNLADDVTLTVNNGALTVTYSPLNYIVRMNNKESSSDALKALVQAMYGYHLEAKYYAGVVKVGVLQTHSAGAASGGIYFSTAEANDAPWGDWNTYYDSNSIDNIKLIRGGETVSVGLTGKNTICKFGANDYYLRLEDYTIGEYAPFTTDDVFVIEGDFTHKDSYTTLHIEKTYIYHDGTSWVFDDSLPTVYDVGVLQAHSAGAASGGIYFSTAEVNDAPYDASGEWTTYYDSNSIDNIKLIRGGETVSVGLTGKNTICKFGANDYYLRLEDYTIGDYAPFTTEDVFVVEGEFTHKDSSTVLNITKTYIYHDGTSWVFADSLPTVYNVGVLQAHSAGTASGGIYFSTAETNDAPWGDWNTYYDSNSIDNIKLIRGGETVSVGLTGKNTICKFGANDYYLRLEDYTIGEYAPYTTDDVFIVEGDFTHKDSNTVLNITKTYIYYNGVKWVFSATEPVPETIYEVGVLSAHTGGGSGTGFHAIGAANDAPYDWAAEYAPSSKECIQIIRNGETIYRENTGAGAIIKFDSTGYYVKFDTWIDSTNYPLQAGDIIIIEGIFVGTGNYAAAEGVQLKIEKTFVTYNGSSFTFSETDPRIINVGAMYAQGGTNWSGNGINFAVDADDLPYNADWSVEYVPTSNEAIKVIRNGQTLNVASTGSGTIVKMSEDNCYLKLESWTVGGAYPITEGDVLVVEGEFKHGDYTMVIDKTYIVIGNVTNDEVTFTTQYENTDFGAVALPTATATMNIGVWNGSYHVFEDKQLQELKAAGITKIMGVNTQWIGTEDVTAWLDRVYGYGISVIFDLRDWDGSTVPAYASHPGVLGFLMYDEPGADVFDDLATLKSQFDAVMPAGKLFYVNLFPECAANSSLGTESSWWDQVTGNTKDYDTDYVTAFLNALNIEVLSWDNYSLITDGTTNGIRTEYFHNFEVMASKNKTMWYTMLSAGHTAGASGTYYDTPTADELRWQMAVAMTYGVQNIDHYVYTSHEEGYSCMVEYETLETTDLYDDIKAVDNEYLAWDNIFTAYDWQGVGVYDTGSTNTMLSVLENKLNLANYGLASVSASEDLLVGVFDHNGDKAYMVTNAGSAGSTTVGDGKNFTMNDASVTLNLGSGYKCVAVIDNGEITYHAVTNNTVTLNVQAYEGVFVIPVKN